MSMIYELIAVSDQTLQGLYADPESVIGLVTGEDETITAGDNVFRVDLDKAWHAIHFMLTGDANGGLWPAGFMLEGGKQIGDVDVGYGPARGLTAEQTAEVAQMLKALPADAFMKRFNPTKFQSADIYPNIWQEGDDAKEYVSEYYDTLREFIENTATRKQALILLVV